MTSDVHALFYANLVTAKGGVRNGGIESAFAATDRVQFCGPGPWKIFTSAGYIETPNDDPRFIYQDVAVALMPERSINNGEPSLHARCLAAVAVQLGDHVLHVGAGTGYYTAMLALLAGSAGQVAAYEIDPDLAGKATANLKTFPQVKVHARSGIDSKLPDSDVVYVNAGATRPEAHWLDALRVGGRLIFPLTSNQGAGVMALVTRRGERKYDARIVVGAAFIPCVGARDDKESEALMTALTKGGHMAIRSLNRDANPDETCWLRGDDWWFSSRGS